MSGVAVVLLVARREFLVRFLSRTFLLGLAVSLVLIVAGLASAAARVEQPSQGSAPTAVAVVAGPASDALTAALPGAGEAGGTAVRVVPLADAATARAQVDDRAVAVALLPDAGGAVTAVARTDLSSSLVGVLDAAVRQAALARALESAGTAPTAVAADIAAARVTPELLSPPDPAAAQRSAIAYASTILLLLSVVSCGTYVATGVVEEKQSRVVELLLATITPLQLLAGKVLGIGALGLLQVVLFGGAGLYTASATGLLTIGAAGAGLLAVIVVWYLLGFAFFALLFAAAGSLVSRQEDAQGVNRPVLFLVLASMGVALKSFATPDWGPARLLSWVPPFSVYLVPSRTAEGLVSPVQHVVALVAMAAACAAVAVLASRVYRRSVLHTGSTLAWSDALSGALPGARGPRAGSSENSHTGHRATPQRAPNVGAVPDDTDTRSHSDRAAPHHQHLHRQRR